MDEKYRDFADGLMVVRTSLGELLSTDLKDKKEKSCTIFQMMVKNFDICLN